MEQYPSHDLDNILRQRLRDAEVPPPAFVWPKVESALKRRKRNLFIWLFSAGVAFAAIWMLWQRTGEQKFVHRTEDRMISAAPEMRPAKTTPVLPQATSSTPAEAAQSSEGQIGTSETPGSPAQLVKKSPGKAGAGRLPVLPDNPPAIPAGDNQMQAAETALLLAGPVARLENQSANSLETAAGFAGLSSGRSSELLPVRLTWLTPPPPNPDVSPVTPLPALRKPIKKCYDFHSNRKAWFLEAYAGPSLARKLLYATNPEFDDYVQDRFNTEHRDWGFNAGVRASYLFAGNFLLRTGLHYDQIVEEFEYIDPSFIKYTVVIKQDYVNGQWVSVSDTIDVEYGSNYVKTYNRFGMLDIPLQAALELRSGATGISLNLGGSVNLFFAKRGSMLEEYGQPVSFTPAKNQYDVFRPRVGFSLLGSIQWFYHIDARTRVFAEPYYRHIMEPVTRAGYPVEQFYGIGGVRFGVTRIIDRK